MAEAKATNGARARTDAVAPVKKIEPLPRGDHAARGLLADQKPTQAADAPRLFERAGVDLEQLSEARVARVVDHDLEGQARGVDGAEQSLDVTRKGGVGSDDGGAAAVGSHLGGARLEARGGATRHEDVKARGAEPPRQGGAQALARPHADDHRRVHFWFEPLPAASRWSSSS